jgi:hypothetical protein
MINIILNYLQIYFPQIIGYALLVLITGLVVWKTAKFYFATKQLHNDFPSIKTLLSDIKTGFTTLNQVLLEKQVISQSCFSQAKSPRQLNPIGEKMYKESGAEALFNLVKGELLAELSKKTFDSFLELERESLNVVLAKMDDTRFKGIQNFAFEHSIFEGNNLTYTDILHVISLKLRNEYLTNHPDNTLAS